MEQKEKIKILLAPDKFKGSLTAFEVCASISKGLSTANNYLEIVEHPLADGGDGSIDILVRYLNLKRVDKRVLDPLGRPVEAHYFLSEKTAYIELATASGLVLLAQKEQNPMLTSTVGTGELIQDACAKGVQEIFLFVGGSATNDGGIGLAHALGFRFLDGAGKSLVPQGQNLLRVKSINDSGVHIDFAQVSIKVLCDVANPLFGMNGAAATYAGQKGASAKEIDLLDAGLRQLSKVIQAYTGIDVGVIPRAGAAGGVGACLVGLMGAVLESGVEEMMRLTGFEKVLTQVDAVVTGEGQLDSQSFDGKVVGQVLQLAKQAGKPLIVIVGQNALNDSVGYPIFCLMDKAVSLDDAMVQAAAHLEKIACEVGLSLWPIS